MGITALYPRARFGYILRDGWAVARSRNKLSTPGQRQVFERFCSEAKGKAGYKIPF